MSEGSGFDTSARVGAGGRLVEVAPGIELHYWDVGAGRPIVLVPGWTFTADVFVHQMVGLSDDHRVIAIDPRSQGRSTKIPIGSDYATHAADLKALIEVLDLDDVTLLGWSAGAAETWGYVRLAGLERVRAHVCVDLSPKCLSSEPGDWVEGSLSEVSEAVMAMAAPATRRDFTTAYIEDVMIQRDVSAAELDWLLRQSETTPDWAALSLYASLMFTDYRPEATLLDGARPSLFVVAEAWAETARAYVERNWPKTEVAVLGGHMMFWEHADAFNTILRDFLARA